MKTNWKPQYIPKASVPWWLAVLIGLVGIAEGLVYGLSLGHAAMHWQSNLFWWQIERELRKQGKQLPKD